MQNNHFVALLLAAGRGERYRAAGGEGLKLLAPIAPGRSVVRQACENLLQAGWPVQVVVGEHASSLRSALAGLDVGFVELPVGQAAGMSDSIRHGVAANRDARGWLVALGDMPFVQAATLRKLAAALEAGAQIVYPVHAGRRGHPVGFAAGLYPELATLAGDVGARDVIRKHVEQTIAVEVDDPGVLLDVDLPDDLTTDPLISKAGAR